MIVVLSLLASAVIAEKFIVISIDSPNLPSSIDSVAVLEDNSFDDTRLYEDHLNDNSSVEIVLEDSSGKVLSRKTASGYRTTFYYDVSIYAIKVLSSGIVVAEKLVSFCDNDLLCEPCEGTYCSLFENQLTCSDCASGSDDGFCDTINDGICDPDCDVADSDCVSFCSEDCGIDDAELSPTCSEFGGISCDPGEDCIGGGPTIYTSDSMFCCIGGFCANTEAYVETMVEMQNQPSMTITPSGVFASTVLSKGIGAYCTDTIGGMFCSQDEECVGDRIEYYYDTFCCAGDCIRSVVEYKPPLDIEIADLNISSDLPAGISFDYDDARIDEKEFLKMEMEEEQEVEDRNRELRETIDFLTPELPEQLKGFSIPIVVGTLLLLLILLFIILGLFHKSASKKMELSESKITNSAQQINIQPLIVSLLSKGYGYAQIRDVLVKKGYPVKMVDTEIKKHYSASKSRI
ncbi:hypothetical protein HQ545_08475 [Candidatus Woesearchaeota archaeon]|nr:hypothetical protein [Candidatus Woesearchaeota archaeon]